MELSNSLQAFKRMLPSYFSHVKAFENTLVTKFFGLHCVKLTGNAQKKVLRNFLVLCEPLPKWSHFVNISDWFSQVRFVIMGNLFCTEVPIHMRFDLKGSSLGRTTEKSEAEIDPNTTLKDLDLNFIFRLQSVWFQDFCRWTTSFCC